MRSTVTDPFLLRCHRWLGWMVLIPALYMSLTGIGVALADQIDRIIDPGIYSVAPVPDQALSRQEIILILETTLGDTPYQLHPVTGVFDTWQASYTVQERGGQQERGRQRQARRIWLHPHSGKVLADKAQSTLISTKLHQLHTADALGWRGVSLLASIAMLLAMASAVVHYRRYTHGTGFWHIQPMLLSLPVVLFQAISGVWLFTTPVPNWLYQLHTGEWLVIRMVQVFALLVCVFGLLRVFRTVSARRLQ